MSMQDDLKAVQRSLDELDRSVARLAQHIGTGSGSLDMRRVRTDAGHLRESLALLSEAAPNLPPTRERPDLVPIPDAPYDNALWTDTDDEGLGARDRHAP